MVIVCNIQKEYILHIQLFIAFRLQLKIKNLYFSPKYLAGAIVPPNLPINVKCY